MKQRLLQEMKNLLNEKEKRNQEVFHQFLQYSPQERVLRNKQELQHLNEKLQSQMNYLMQAKQQQFNQALQSLDLLSPLKIMGRGFSYTTKDNQVVKSVQELAVKDKLLVNYPDGQVLTIVEEIRRDNDGESNI